MARQIEENFHVFAGQSKSIQIQRAQTQTFRQDEVKRTQSNYTNYRSLKNISSSLKLNVAFSLKVTLKV